LIVKALRGLVKSAGGRLPACSTASLQTRAEASVPATLAAAAKPLLEQVEGKRPSNTPVSGIAFVMNSGHECGRRSVGWSS
jgi:hypothetical protein